MAWLPRAEMRKFRVEETWKERAMGFFSLGSGSHGAKPKRMQRFEQADCVVVKAFADLHKARYLKSNQFPSFNGSNVGLGIG